MLSIDSSILYISYAILTFLSLWVVIQYKGHRLFKAFFIPFALILALSTYFSIEALKGSPTRTEITEEVQLHWYIVSKQTGQIFLWVSKIDSITPRAYEIPYSDQVAESLEEMGKRLRKGFKIILSPSKSNSSRPGKIQEEEVNPFEYQLKGSFPPTKQDSQVPGLSP